MPGGLGLGLDDVFTCPVGWVRRSDDVFTIQVGRFGLCIYMTGAIDSSPVPNNCYGFFINQIKNFHHMLKIYV